MFEHTHNDPVRWGIISTANIGVSSVGPAIQTSSNGRLVAVASRTPCRVAELYSFVPNMRIYDDYESIINDPDIEAVYIPLPNSLHVEWTIKALAAGKHVLCEKPLSVTVKEGQRMFDAAQAHNRLLMEAFMYRFHPQTRWVLDQIQAGVIGPVRLIRASFAFDARSRPEDIRLNSKLAGGSLMDVGCYPVNLCRAVYGEAPQTIVARVHVPKDLGVEMATNAVLDFGDGRFGLIDSSLMSPGRQVAEIIGEGGSITIQKPFTPGTRATTVFVMKDNQVTERTFSIVNQYQLEVDYFAACIRSGMGSIPGMNETLENMATIEAIYQAAGLNWPLV